jgi:hypothetical protein
MLRTKKISHLFDDCLFVRKRFYFCSGAYLVNYDCLLKSAKWPMHTSKEAGQNWQLLLPVLWNYRCRSIPDVWYSVLCRSASHSRGQYSGYEKSVIQLDTCLRITLETLYKIKDMPADVCLGFKRLKSEEYLAYRMKLCFRYGKTKDYNLYYKKMAPQKIKHVLMYFFCKFAFVKALL